MFKVTLGIHIHFAHHVRGHMGPCISLHGHTWLFEVTLGAKELDNQGFVVDFDQVHDEVLKPCHDLLDHSLALGEQSWAENHEALATLGHALVASRDKVHGHRGERQPGLAESNELAGARNMWPGDIKVAVFPFTPTSERLAQWLASAAQTRVGSDRVKVIQARVVETLHPTEASAVYEVG